jgi:N-acetylglucosaminyldiphosphoundecaprenol N-acetyl-beta-D-mannosaminyltransferase
MMTGTRTAPLTIRHHVILGVPVAALDAPSALAAIARLVEEAPPVHLVYVNAHTLNLASRDAGYRATLERATLILRDGAGVGLAGRLQGRRFPANLNGSDFNPRLLRLAAERGWSVFLLGAKAGVAQQAGERLAARIAGLRVAGARDGYFRDTETPQVLTGIRRSGADVLMAAFGNPRQEAWLDRHLDAAGVRLGVGVGGFLDFAAGRVPRAPRWMRGAGVEWVYRLWREPRRLWRRYVLGNPEFLVRVLRAEVERRAGREPRDARDLA